MSFQVFPTFASAHPKFEIVKTDSFRTTITPYGDPVVQRISEVRFPLRTVKIPYSRMPIADRNTIYKFFRQRFGSGESFWYFHNRQELIFDEYLGYATGSAQTLDLPSKETVNDATFILYADGVANAKTFVSGGGEGSSDRVTFTATVGKLMTCECYGKQRLLTYLGDDYGDRWTSFLMSAVDIVLYEDPNET